MLDDYARFRPLFAEAVDRRLFSLDHLDALILSGQAQFWPSSEAAIVTQIKTYPTGAQVICGLVAAGDLREIVEQLIPRAEQWGKSVGCIMASIESRPGWAKALKPSGYTPHQLCVMKEL